MKLIVGLGNPGSKYAQTRHNIGRRLVESIALQCKAVFKKKNNLDAELASLNWDAQDVVLAYPTSYMNVSGEPIRKLIQYFEIDFSQDLLIITDDLALPFGRLRLRPKGSDGGHNGLKSIITALTSQNFPRLRIGVGHPADLANIQSEDEVKDYVLAPFEKAEEKGLPVILEKGREACHLWVSQGMQAAMNAVNPEEKKS